MQRSFFFVHSDHSTAKCIDKYAAFMNYLESTDLNFVAGHTQKRKKNIKTIKVCAEMLESFSVPLAIPDVVAFSNEFNSAASGFEK
jgi:hypothetical protein